MSISMSVIHTYMYIHVHVHRKSYHRYMYYRPVIYSVVLPTLHIHVCMMIALEILFGWIRTHTNTVAEGGLYTCIRLEITKLRL